MQEGWLSMRVPTLELVVGNMRSGKTTYAKNKKHQYLCYDKLLEDARWIWPRFYSFLINMINHSNMKNKDIVMDGWFSSYNWDPFSIKKLQKDIPHRVLLTVFYCPLNLLLKRDKRNNRELVLSVYEKLISFYKNELKDVDFCFRDSERELSFREFMQLIRLEMVNVSKKAVQNFIAVLDAQKDYDRYYQTLRLPYGLTIKGYERTELTWEIIAQHVPFRGKNVLDVGCYHGFCCFSAEDEGASRVVGIEKEARILQFSNMLKDIWNYQTYFINADIDHYEPKEHFDVVLCLNMIQYVADPSKVAEKLLRYGKTVILECTEEHKKRFDKVGTHNLLFNLPTPRTKDLHRRLYIYQRKKSFCEKIHWFNIYANENRLYLFYNHLPPKKIGLALSADGQNFSLINKEVFGVKTHIFSKNWENVLLESHTVLPFPNGYRMYYGGYNGSTWRVGVAFAEKIEGPWTRYFGNPILSPNTEWESRDVSDPHVLKIGKFYFMYYVARGAFWQTGLAVSSDGLQFERWQHNPVLKAEEEWNDGGIVLSGILPFKNKLLGTAHGYSLSNQKFTCYLYESSNGLSWKKKRLLGTGMIHPELHFINGCPLLYYTDENYNFCIKSLEAKL